jgi:hypothetical protein
MLGDLQILLQTIKVNGRQLSLQVESLAAHAVKRMEWATESREVRGLFPGTSVQYLLSFGN